MAAGFTIASLMPRSTSLLYLIVDGFTSTFSEYRFAINLLMTKFYSFRMHVDEIKIKKKIIFFLSWKKNENCWLNVIIYWKFKPQGLGLLEIFNKNMPIFVARNWRACRIDPKANCFTLVMSSTNDSLFISAKISRLGIFFLATWTSNMFDFLVNLSRQEIEGRGLGLHVKLRTSYLLQWV